MANTTTRAAAPAGEAPQRPATAPKLLDDTATKDDWTEFRGIYAGWVAKATDADLLAEMAALPVEGRPLSPAEAWMYHQCELRRRRPAGKSR